MDDDVSSTAPSSPNDPTGAHPPVSGTGAPDPAASAAAGAPAEPAPTPPPAPARKRHGCLTSFVIVLVVLLVSAGGVYVWMRSQSQPRDLGIHATEADFDSALVKAGVQWPVLPAGANPADYERVYTGSQPLDATFTEAELSALMSFRHSSSYWPVSDVQVDITGPDSARMSAVVSYGGQDWPVYVEGTAGFSGSTLWADVADASVGPLHVPSNLLSKGSSLLESLVNDRLARIPGLDITSIEVTDAGLHVVGTTWQTAEYVKTS